MRFSKDTFRESLECKIYLSSLANFSIIHSKAQSQKTLNLHDVCPVFA